ncbi:MAG: peptigoglycan-binding protein LysM [Gammaproteobacteria bacterium]|nr:MAG: peptigoglycan-binding protein LysM [Gammaproteobacteria bacterium]
MISMENHSSAHVSSRFLSVCLLGSLLLGGCATLDRLSAPGEAAPGESAAPVVVQLEQPPLDTSRFVVADPAQRVVGELQVLQTRDEDTFVDIARAYNLGFEELVAANPDVDPWLPGEGTAVVLPTRFILPPVPREGIVINNAQMRLFYFEPPGEDGTQVVYTHPIGIGRLGRATPTGQSTVIDKATDPTWYPPLSVRREHAEQGDPLPAIVPPGPDNPLGRHVFRLGLPSYLIHGTNQPPGVGMRVSAGCVRMFPEDIEALYPRIALGTPVRLINEPVLAAWHGRQLYVDAHAPLEEDARDPEKLLVDVIEQAMAEAGQPLGTVDFRRAASLLAEGRGIALPTLRNSADHDQVLAAARRVENVVAPGDGELAALREPTNH